MKLLFLLLFILTVHFGFAQPNRCFQKVILPSVAINRSADPTNTGTTSFTYFDGLGRPIQTVTEAYTTTSKDLVQAIEYDQFGSIHKELLPYTTQGSGNFRNDALIECKQFYQQAQTPTSYPFSEQEFEPSPEAFLTKKAAAGENFRMGSGHESKYTERPNQLSDSILHFGFNYANMKPTVSTVQGLLVKQLNFDGINLGAFTYPSLSILNCSTNMYAGISPNSAANQPNAFLFNSGYGNSIQFNLNKGNYLLSCFVKKLNGGSTVVYLKNNTTTQILNGQFSLDNNWIEVKIPFSVLTNNNQFVISCSGPTGKVLLDDIRIYSQQNNTILPQYFADGSCWIKSKINANGQDEIQVYDVFNKLLLHRIYNNSMITIETYYVYNRHGMLAAIVQPEGVKALYNNQFDFNSKISNGSGGTSNLFDLYVQQNIYDERNRLITQKLPGTGITSYVYDLLDRMVMSQDPQQALDFKWTFQKFDQQGRPVIKGVFQTERNMPRSDLQDRFNKSLVYYEYTDRKPLFYSNQVFPTSNIVDTLVLNYYDNCDADMDGNKEWDFQGSTQINQSAFKKLMVTKAKLLGKSASGWVTKINGYDFLGRNNLMVTRNPMGGFHSTERTFNFRGLILTELNQQRLNAQQSLYEWRIENEYDMLNRLQRTWLTNPDGTKVVMREMNYNELGKVVKKKLHAIGLNQPFLQSIDYSFNLQGQLIQINDVNDLGNDDLFAMNFVYDENFIQVNSGGVFMNTPNYLSFLSACSWISKRDEVLRGYLYNYDRYAQLQTANYFGNYKNGLVNENARYEVKQLSYDLNGNILSMQQHGLVNSQLPNAPTSYDWIDKLNYSYNGNQLLSVSDASTYTMQGYNHFIDRNAKGADYLYDANQRLITDKNKGIQLITYNPIGLPSTIKWNNGDELEFIYDALGNKQQSKFSIQGKKIHEWDYVAGTYYVDKTIRSIAHDEGRMVYNPNSNLKANAGNFLFHYDYIDHQGNTRMTFMPLLDTSGNWICTYEFEPEQTVDIDTSSLNMPVNSEVFLNKSEPIQSMEDAHNGKFSGKTTSVIGTNILLNTQLGDTIQAHVFGKLKEDHSANNPPQPNWLFQLIGMQQLNAIPYQEHQINQSPSIYLNLIAVLGGLKFLLRSLQQVPELKGALVLRALDSTGQVVKAIASPLLGNTSWEHLSAQLVVDSSSIQKVEVFVSSSDENVIFYDDFSVIRKRMLAQIVQENHYYPFGLNIQGLEFVLPNTDTNTTHLFNGKSLLLKNYLEYFDHGSRFLDPQIGRWHTMDIMAGQFISQSPYVAMQNNPVNNIDPNGMQSWDPPGKFGFVMGIRMGFGTTGFNFNTTSSIGYQLGEPSANMQLIANMGMYGGSQLGTNASHTFAYDLSAGFLMQGGIGNAAPHHIYTMNYNTPSPFLNTNEYGAHWGQLFAFNSAINHQQDGPGIQTQGLFGMRMGNSFSFSYNNDATTFPSFAGLFRNKLGIKETDAAWTGGLAINIAGVEFGYQNFSGYRLMNYPGFGLGHKYPQTSFHQSLNKASNFLQYNGMRLDVFGSAWLQDFIHNHISKESTYEYSKTNQLNLSGSIR